MKNTEINEYGLEVLTNDIKHCLATFKLYDLNNKCRELSIVKTKLEEADMWLSKLIKEGEK